MSQPKIPEKIVDDATTRATTSQMYEVGCENIQSVEVIQYDSCVTSSKRVQSRTDSVSAKCDNRKNRFLLSKCQKYITARICIKGADEQQQWYSLFSPVLTQIINEHNNKNATHYDIETLDEERLSDIILLAVGMKIMVNNSNNVVKQVNFA